MECPPDVQKEVCIQAGVKVTPNVEIGEAQSFCVGSPKFKPCHSEHCDYLVSQLVCVQFPIKFSADAEVDTAKIVCEPPCCLPLPHRKKACSCVLSDSRCLLFLMIAMICGLSGHCT